MGTKVKKQTFYLIRHGETDWNRAKKLQGHSDIVLNDHGRRQAKQLAQFLSEHLGSISPTLYSSPLLRAFETARILAETLLIKTHLQHRGLMEVHLGQAEGLGYDESRQTFGDEHFKKWRSNNPDHLDARYPGGESGREVRDRAILALQEILKKHDDPILVVSHGSLIRRLLSFFAGHARHFELTNCVTYKIEVPSDYNFWNQDNIDVQGPLFTAGE